MKLICMNVSEGKTEKGKNKVGKERERIHTHSYFKRYIHRSPEDSLWTSKVSYKMTIIIAC